DRAQADRGSRYVRPRHEVRAHSAGVVARADARSRAVSEELHGTRAIREAQLEAFDNRTPERDYTVQFTIPEFTCLCPISGFPDFVTLHAPRCCEVIGDFNVLGNIKTVVRARHRDDAWTGDVDPWWTPPGSGM